MTNFIRMIRSSLVALSATLILLLTAVGSVAAASITEYSVPTANSVPFGIIAGPDGALWFTEYNTNKIGRLAAGVFTEFSIPTANSGPTSIALGPDNALWFTESLADKIGKLTPAGIFSEYSLTANSAPHTITAGPDGALWFTESARNRIGRISTAGVVTHEFLVPTPDSQPQGIVTGSDGALWFVERAANKIGRVTTAGVFTEYSIPTPNAGAIEIAAGPDGALWFTESIANQIGRITTTGLRTEYLVPTSNSSPIDIVAGPNNSLWFTQNNGNKIGQITTGGLFTEYAIPTLNSVPNGIAALGGNLWFTEAYGNKIGALILTPSVPSTVYLPFVIKAAPPPPCVPAGTYDDTNANIVYAGSWQLYSGTGPYNDTMHYSDNINDSAQLVFCGVGVTILYAAGPNGGVTNVSIDGVPAGTINHYSATTQWQVQWVSGALANGTHVLTLTHASGTRVNLDAINVTPAPPAPSSICVSVYYDKNGNQIFDAGEPLLRGAGIVVRNSSDTQVGSFVSYDTGARCLTNLPADTYTVTETDPPAFASTTTNTRTAIVSAGGTANIYFGDSVWHPNGMVSDTNRGHLFITTGNASPGWLLVWDEVNNRTLTTISVGTKPAGVGLVNDRVFVAEDGSKVVAVVDAATLVRVKDINLAPICDGAPKNVAVNPNTNKVYVSLYGYPGRVAVIDAVTLAVNCLELTGDGTTGVAVNTALNQLYVTSRDAQLLQVFDISPAALPGVKIQDVPLGGQAYFVQAKPSTNQVYVTLAFDSSDYQLATTLRSYNATTGGVTLGTSAVISNTADGGTIWVSRTNGKLYVAATADDRVQIINPTTLAIESTLPMPDPFPITENDVIFPRRIYIGNRNANLITELYP